MSGGPKYEYLWQDGSKFKKPTKLPANQYISLLMDWIEGQVNDTAIFPLTDDVPFPKNFGSVCKKVRSLLAWNMSSLKNSLNVTSLRTRQNSHNNQYLSQWV